MNISVFAPDWFNNNWIAIRFGVLSSIILNQIILSQTYKEIIDDLHEEIKTIPIYISVPSRIQSCKRVNKIGHVQYFCNFDRIMLNWIAYEDALPNVNTGMIGSIMKNRKWNQVSPVQWQIHYILYNDFLLFFVIQCYNMYI